MSHPEQKDEFIRSEVRDYYRFVRRAKTLLLVFCVVAFVQGIVGTFHPNQLVFGTALMCFTLGVPGSLYIWRSINRTHSDFDLQVDEITSEHSGLGNEQRRITTWRNHATQLMHIATALVVPGIAVCVGGALLKWNPLIVGIALALMVISAFWTCFCLIARYKADMYLHALTRDPASDA